MVELRAITKENLEEVLRLKVHEYQQAYVSTTAHSLAQAYVYRDTAFPFAICVDNEIVGFIMLGYYEAQKQYTLWKFLIDQRHQGKGYGKKALKLGLQFLKDRFGAREVYTGVLLGNERAKHLYRCAGFRETGLVQDNMEEMRYAE